MPHHKSPAQSPDLGYHWIWTYGHLFPTAVFTGAAITALALGAPWWAWVPLAAFALWMFCGFLVMRFGVRMNQVPRLPAKNFLVSGQGRVLDVGCGSGRLSISILQARPNARVVGLDNFSADYISGHGASNTERNYQLAGIADRATIETGDMRAMPFADAVFDAAASSAAIDHLQPDDIRQTLREIHRVLVPGGQFLLMVIVPNLWLTIAFGPLMAGKMQGRRFWRESLSEAGFSIEQEGTARTTALFLARTPDPTPAR